MEDEKNIHAAIIGVMKEVGYVQKKRSAGLNYSYAGEAALIEAIRPAMVEHGIFMFVKEITKVNRENYVTAKGTAMANTMLQTIVRFVHAPSDTFIDVASVGEGADAGDKSANKASTGQYKYAIRQTFCIETGDDPDQTPSEQLSRGTKTISKVDSVSSPVVAEAVEIGGVEKFGKSNLMALSQINALRDLTGAEVPAVIAEINKLEKGHTYALADVAKLIKGE